MNRSLPLIFVTAALVHGPGAGARAQNEKQRGTAKAAPSKLWADAGGAAAERLARRWALEKQGGHTQAEGESLNLNRHLARLGYERALAELDAAVKAYPQEPDALYYRGRLQIMNGKQEPGLADFKAALALKPRHAFDHGTRASVYNWVARALGRPARPGDATAVEVDKLRALAIKELDAAVQLDPKYALAYHDRSILARDAGDAEGAVRDINKAIELAPDHPAYLYARAGHLWRANRPGDATADLTRALDLYPQYDEAYRLRGIYYLDRGQPQKALADFDALIRMHPKPSPLRSAGDVGESYFLRATAYLNMAHTRYLEPAIDDLTAVIEIDPKNVAAYEHRARAYRQRKMIALAMGDEKKVGELRKALVPPPK